MTRTEWLHAAFDRSGDNADEALKLLADGDADLMAEYEEAAVKRAYQNDYRTWVRSLTRTVKTENLGKGKGAVKLFADDGGQAEKHIRERIVIHDEDGVRREYDQFALAGEEGAKLLRAVAQRDERHARTTFERSRFQLKLADAIEAESKRLHRDVSVAEVLGLAEAA